MMAMSLRVVLEYSDLVYGVKICKEMFQASYPPVLVPAMRSKYSQGLGVF